MAGAWAIARQGLAGAEESAATLAQQAGAATDRCRLCLCCTWLWPSFVSRFFHDRIIIKKQLSNQRFGCAFKIANLHVLRCDFLHLSEGWQYFDEWEFDSLFPT